MLERLTRVLLFCVLALYCTTFAGAQPLQASRPWVLDYATARCVATRSYNGESSPVILGIRPSPDEQTYELLVIRDRTGPEVPEQFQGTVDFGNGAIKTSALRYSVAGSRNEIFQYQLSSEEMSQGRTAKKISMKSNGTPEFEFELATVPKVLGALSGCIKDLKRYWNFDGEKDGRIAVPANGDLKHAFSMADLYMEGLYNSTGKPTQFLLLIDEKGAIASCYSLVPSHAPILNSLECTSISLRAHFKPARDANGKAVRSAFTTPPLLGDHR